MRKHHTIDPLMALIAILTSAPRAAPFANSEALSTVQSTDAQPVQDVAEMRGFVTFTLLRGGPAASSYELFANSRRCLRDAIRPDFLYDDVAFHEGNVPIDAQLMLAREFPRSRFMDVRDVGGFSEHARELVPEGEGAVEYPIGYRHMCHFMSMLWFGALREYEYAMRVDEDVCITMLPSHELLAALSSDYAYGLETAEAHRETVETFTPWFGDYITAQRLQPTIPPLPTDRIFFTNFFVARVGWWERHDVRRFLRAVNESGGIYRHRWGDAPIQTAALRLHASAQSVLHLHVDYVHLSTRNRIKAGEEVAFGAAGLQNPYFRRLAMEAANASEVNSSNASEAIGSFARSPQPPPPQIARMLPPMPPAPPGTVGAVDAERLRALLAMATDPGSAPGLEIYLLPGVTIPLGGAPLVVGNVNATLRSVGAGATLDAGGRSRIFDVQPGAHLRLQAITLVNGYSTSDGGAMNIFSATVEMLACVVANGSANQGGAVSIGSQGLLTLVGSTLRYSHAMARAGALKVSESTAELFSCTLEHLTAVDRGGSVFVQNGVLTLKGSTLFNSSTTDIRTQLTGNKGRGGAIFVSKGSATITSCTITNSSSGENGGMAYFKNGMLALTSCAVAHSSAGVNGGVLYVKGGTEPPGGIAILMNSTFTLSSSGSYGGMIGMAFGSLEMWWSSISDSSAQVFGGVMFLEQASVMFHGCTVSRAIAQQTGGGMLLLGGSVTLSHCEIINSTAVERGGGFTVVGGSLTIVQSTMGQLVAAKGGALYLNGGSMDVADCVLLDTRASSSGGMLYLDAGQVTLHASTVMRAASEIENGGAVIALGGSMNISCSNISSSYARFYGGAIYVVGGRVTVTHQSLIVDSMANQGGGALAIAGGRVTVFDSTVSSGSVGMPGNGGCFHLASGELELTGAVVEHCDDSITFVPSGTPGDGPLLLATRTTFRQHLCDPLHGSLFNHQGAAQLVLRLTSFVPLSGCDTSALSFEGVEVKGCFETYTDTDGEAWEVCSSRSPGACTAQSIDGTSLYSLTCECPPPEFGGPGFDPSDAPYAPFRSSAPYSVGCVEPLAMDDVLVISTDVAVALYKPERQATSRNVTLRMRGTDETRPANWSIVNAATLPSWLGLPLVGGPTKSALEISETDTDVPIALDIYATGLHERAAPYKATLNISVRSEVAAVSRWQLLHVLLTVQATTAFAVWGHVQVLSGLGRCLRAAQMMRMHSSITAGEMHREAFTACDVEELPVDHQLPSQNDPRRFTASLSTSNKASEWISTEYVGNGLYEVLLSVPTHGPFKVALHLDDEVAVLDGNATCRSDRVSLQRGGCGCSAGFFQTETKDCEVCPLSTTSPDGAIGTCTIFATSFAVWGLVSMEARCEQKAQVGLNGTIVAGEMHREAFTACDIFGRPVSYELPTSRDPRSFSAMLHANGRVPEAARVDYVGNGVYNVLLNVPTHGSLMVTVNLGEIDIVLTATSVCPSDLVPLQGGRCGCNVGFFQLTDQTPCEPCSLASTSSAIGSVGSESCNVCSEGHFRPSASISAALCERCLQGAHCLPNATLETLILRDGFWRLSPFSTRILKCDQRNGTAPSCLGGSSVGRCAVGQEGPRCAVCTEKNRHYDASTGDCAACPSITQVALWALPTTGSGLSLVAFLFFAWSRRPHQLRRLTRLLDGLLNIWDSVGLGAKLRMVIAFYQCVTNIGSVYSVELPQEYQDVIAVFDWLDVNWLEWFIPAECVGSFEVRMVSTALAPLALLGLVGGANVFGSRGKGAPFVDGLLASTNVCLVIIFLIAPTTNRAIFNAWDCVPYELSETTNRYFLQSALDVECDSSRHKLIVACAFVLAAVWPFGSVALFASLALIARRKMRAQTPDRFVRSTRFLHKDFKPECFYWASVELALRSILTGWVLLFPAEKSFVRLIVALLASVFVLVWMQSAAPYRNPEENLLLQAGMVLLVLTYTCSTYIKVFNDFADATSHALAASVLGIDSTTAFITLLGVVCFILLIILFVTSLMSVVNDERRGMPVLVLSASKTEPILTLAPDHRFMLFISHVWSTGQDQAATIKRQLQCMLPSASIFLDVDDLESVTLLESHIRRSASFLSFLSSGYLLSKSCVREVRFAVQVGTPRILVRETEQSKGAAPLTQLHMECSQSLRDDVFGKCLEKRVIPWYRGFVFQSMSLKLIAEDMLLASPEYADRALLPLEMRGEVTTRDLAFDTPICLFTSEANNGAEDVAGELRTLFGPNVQSTSTLPSAMVEQIEKLEALGASRRRPSAILSGGVFRRTRASQSSRCSCPGHRSSISSGHQTVRATLSRESLSLARGPASVLFAAPAAHNTLDGVTHFLLYLSQDVFCDAAGPVLAAQVRAARALHLKVVLVHELDEAKGGCPFPWCMSKTPDDLIEAGLYKDLAVALLADQHRAVSMVLLAKALGATKKQRSIVRASTIFRSWRVSRYSVMKRLSLRKTMPPRTRSLNDSDTCSPRSDAITRARTTSLDGSSRKSTSSRPSISNFMRLRNHSNKLVDLRVRRSTAALPSRETSLRDLGSLRRHEDSARYSLSRVGSSKGSARFTHSSTRSLQREGSASLQMPTEGETKGSASSSTA